MIVENVFENIIFPDMKKYVEENSIYEPLVVKGIPLISGKFPIVPTKLLPVENQYNNLSYGEQTYTFAIEINVYAQDQNKKSKRTICYEVTSKVVEYFEKYHVTIRTELDVENIDSNVHRNKIKISGKLDTKYGLDNLVIYPK